MLYMTNRARKSHEAEITRLIDVLGHTTELGYVDYRRIVSYLADLRDMIRAEIKLTDAE